MGTGVGIGASIGLGKSSSEGVSGITVGPLQATRFSVLKEELMP